MKTLILSPLGPLPIIGSPVRTALFDVLPPTPPAEPDGGLSPGILIVIGLAVLAVVCAAVLVIWAVRKSLAAKKEDR